MRPAILTPLRSKGRASTALSATVLSATVLLILAGCSEPAKKAPAAPAPAPAPATLAGVDLAAPISVLGTEPFWNIEITSETLSYADVEAKTLQGPNPGPVVQGTTAAYTTRLGDQPLELTLIATECSDGMSDRTYPLTAIVKLGETRLNGCAISKAGLAALPPA